MKLKSLNLKNFRNYSVASLILSPNVNIFIGDNGSGKTNILEAIYVLSLTKSSRYGTEVDLIKNGESGLNIMGEVEKEDYIKKYEVKIDKFAKRVFINNTQIKKISSYISEFCITSFLPNDIEIIKGSPSIRRNLLNIQIGMLYNNYLKFVNEYNSLLRIRNDYLKRLSINSFSDGKYLDIINDKMIDLSVKIYYFRFFYLSEINKILPDVFKKISGVENVKVGYQNSLNIEYFDENKIREIMQKKYKNNLNKEIMQGVTITGLHRDDLVFFLNDLDAKIYASQGQQRLLVIAYKISELLLFKKIKNDYPVLLLDDVFSEIDSKKRNKIVKFFKDDIQVIITTTDIEDINEKIVEKAKVFFIKNGEIKIKGGAKCKRKK